MTPRRIILGLAALNVGLLATLLVTVYAFKDPAAQVSFPPRPRSVTNTVTQIAVRKFNATNLLAAIASMQIRWSDLESTNYVDYIENLRAFGCPEVTIRDIIITDVARAYARRRAALQEPLGPFKFWETTDQVEARTSPGSAYGQQLAALQREERELIRALLGVDLDTELARYGDHPDLGPDYSFVGPEKEAKIREVLSKHGQLEQQIYDASRGFLLESDEARLRQLERQRDAELAQVLSPEEYQEYQLRFSDTAQAMRAELSGFNPTEREFREIFRLQRTFEDEMSEAFEGLDDRLVGDIREQATLDAGAALERELRSVLGDERYAEYQRIQDADYQALVQLSDRLGSGPGLAERVYNMKLTAQRQRERVLNNPSFNYEQRRAALDALARETENSVGAVMGEGTFRSYRDAYGGWIEDLAVSPPPPEPPPSPKQPPLPPGLFIPFPPVPMPDVNNPIRQ